MLPLEAMKFTVSTARYAIFDFDFCTVKIQPKFNFYKFYALTWQFKFHRIKIVGSEILPLLPYGIGITYEITTIELKI